MTSCESLPRAVAVFVAVWVKTSIYIYIWSEWEWGKIVWFSGIYGIYVLPPKTGELALWPNTRVVKCTYCVSQKRKEANDQGWWYNILLTFIY